MVTSFPGSAAAPVVKDLQVSGGKILAGGNSGLVRYLADGTLDGSFGDSGRVSLSGVSFTAMAVDGDGHIYVLGQTTTKTVLLRYQADGELDGDYRSDGTALVTASKTFTPQALAVQADGKVLVAGVAGNGSSESTLTRVYRLEADGSPDLAFGTSAATDIQLGTGTLLAPSLADQVTGMVAGSDGTILIGGGAMSYFAGGFDPVSGELKPFSYGDTMFAVARLSADGTLDSSYATGGIRRSTFVSGAKSNFPGAFAVMDDGTAALASSSVASGRVIFASFTPDGMLEVNKTADAGYELSGPLDMTSGSDGRFFLLGDNPGRDYGLQIAAVTPAGVFSNVAYTQDAHAATTSITGGSTGQIAVADDGDLIVAGQADSPGYALAKYDAGQADATPPDELASARANSIYRDSSGGLHLAYFDAAERVLKYSYRAPDGLWDAPVTVDATDNAGQFVSVGADSQGNPAIAYFEGTHGDLKFAWRSNGIWRTETVDSRGSVGLYPSMIFYGPGWPAVTYFDKTHGDLKFAVRNMATGKWGFEEVQRTGIVGRSSSLATNPSTGRFEVAYVDTGKGLVDWGAPSWRREVGLRHRGHDQRRGGFPFPGLHL